MIDWMIGNMRQHLAHKKDNGIADAGGCEDAALEDTAVFYEAAHLRCPLVQSCQRLEANPSLRIAAYHRS